MDDVPLLLALPLGFLFIACWIGGTLATFRATRERGRWSRRLWRAAVIAFPVTGFLLFELSGRVRRRNPATPNVGRSEWKWLAAHALLIALAIPAYVIARTRAVVHVESRHEANYRQEWWFRRNGFQPPSLCVAMSGGGIRSAAFNIGVLRGLHEHGLLAKTEVMSGVSGGSYALSWYLLQQYYAHQDAANRVRLPRANLPDAMFDRDGIFQKHLAASARQFSATGTASYYASLAFAAALDLSAYNVARLLSTAGNENLRNLSLSRQQYRESLQNTFHLVKERKEGDLLPTVYNGYVTPGEGRVGRWTSVATRYAGHVNLSVADEVTFSDLSRFAEKSLPFFVFVTTVDVDAKDQPGTQTENPDRLWPSVFELNAWGLGSDSYGHRSWAQIPADDVRFSAVRLVNVAPAISGAALSPASGGLSVHRQRLMSFGNVDLGYRVPRFDAGEAGSVYLSDGGHIENLGLYPLVRRDCRNIVVIDAEYEPALPYEFKSYHKVKKALPSDLKRVLMVRGLEGHAFNHAVPVVTGTITGAPDRTETTVYYIKLTMDKARDYGDLIDRPALGQSFPQDPTSDQNFDEMRFRAYRELGYIVARESPDLEKLASRLATPTNSNAPPES